MKLPEKSRHWLREIEKAFSKAVLKADKEVTDEAYLYRYAPELVSRARGLSKSEIIQAMKDDVEARVQQDWKFEAKSRNHYKFHFVSSYIYAHAAAGFLDERQADRVMDDVNQNLDLFDDCDCGASH